MGTPFFLFYKTLVPIFSPNITLHSKPNLDCSIISASISIDPCSKNNIVVDPPNLK